MIIPIIDFNFTLTRNSENLIKLIFRILPLYMIEKCMVNRINLLSTILTILLQRFHLLVKILLLSYRNFAPLNT